MDIEVLSKNNELKEESYSFDLRRDQNVVMTNKFIEGRWTLDIITSRVFFMALAMVHDTHTSETQYVIEIKKLTPGHAKILVGLENAEFVANKIIEKNLSVRQAENFVKNF